MTASLRALGREAEALAVPVPNPYAMLAVRRGILLRAMARHSSDDIFVGATRSLSEATQLGLKIYDNFDAYSERMQSIVESFLDDKDVKYGKFSISRKEEMRSKYAPGLILDFPRFELSLGPYHVTGRCCITICFADSVSKVWSRLIMEDLDNKLIDQEDEIARYLHIGSEICGKLNDEVQKLYFADFDAHTKRSDEVELSFDRVGSLDYYGLDEEPELIEGVTNIVEGDPQIDDRQISKLKKHLTFLAHATKSPSDDAEKRHLARIVNDLHAFTGEQGQQALFAADVEESAVSFFVASGRLAPFSPKMQQQYNRARNSSALDTIQELATLLATKF